MPAYDYLCQDCDKVFEVHKSFAEYSEESKPKCPNCGSKKVLRNFSGFNVLAARRGAGRASGGCGPGAGPGCCG